MNYFVYGNNLITVRIHFEQSCFKITSMNLIRCVADEWCFLLRVFPFWCFLCLEGMLRTGEFQSSSGALLKAIKWKFLFTPPLTGLLVNKGG